VFFLGFRIEIKPALPAFSGLLHSGCTQIVVRESKKIHEERGGGASAHPTTSKFSDLFALTPIFIRPEINGKKIKYGRGQTVQCNAVQCSIVQYSRV